MSEMIERVATAIHKDSALEPAGLGILSLPTCRLIAATAIKAMREPTEKMIDEGYSTKTFGDGVSNIEKLWPAMIDAALSPESRG